MIATMFRRKTGFFRTSGVVEAKRYSVIGMSRVGKTVSTMRRSTTDPSSAWRAGGSMRGVSAGCAIGEGIFGSASEPESTSL